MEDARLARLLQASPVSRRAAAGGYTPARREVVRLDDGRSVFVKAAVNDLTAGWLRKEHRLYAALGAPFMPRLIAWDDGELPVLVLEDLSAAFWPPPWTDAQIATVLRTLAQVAATPPPPWLEKGVASDLVATGWSFVAADPAPLLGTGVVDATWLQASLPRLAEAAESCRLDGDELVHFDVRSDNLCFRADGSAAIVDWNFAEAGNARLDVAFWAPSLHLEGGPEPWSVLPDAPSEAAVVSGYFAAHCGLPPIPDAPRVRPFQLAQLRVSLPWACRELGLPLP